MRQILLLLCAVLLLAACGGNAPLEMASAQPLRVEVRRIGADYEWFLNDETSPTSIPALKVAMEDYARVVDREAGLTGVAPDGVSENPVMFRAAFGAPGRYFASFVEIAVSAMLYHTRLELTRENLTALSVDLDLPRDEGLSSAPLDELLKIQMAQRELLVEYSIGLRKEKQGVVSAETLDLQKFSSGWNDAAYRTTRDQLVDALIAKEAKAKLTPEAVWLVVDFEKPVVWGAWFLAVDAVEAVNSSGKRGDRPKWPVTLMSPIALPEEPPAEELPHPFPPVEEVPEPPPVRPGTDGD